MKSKDSVIVNLFPPSHSTVIWADSWIEPQSCRNKIHQTHHCNYQEMSGVWCTEKTTLKLFQVPLTCNGWSMKGYWHLGRRNSWTVWRKLNLIQETPSYYICFSSSGAGWTKWSLSLQAMISSQSTTWLISSDINLTRFTASQSLCKQASKILSLTWIARVT